MEKWKKLAHVVYQCSYHVAWRPKYRYRILEGDISRMMENETRTVCEWKGVDMLELNIRKDHVHMVAAIPQRISISDAMGIIKEKAAIALFKGHTNLKDKAILGELFLE